VGLGCRPGQEPGLNALGSKIFNLGYSRAFPGGGRELWNRKSHVTHALQIVPIMIAISFLAF
jgi:hypothetical protein